MTGRPTKRGDIVQVFNRLLDEGRIAGFSSNLFEKPPPQQPAVTIFNRREDDPKAVGQTVLQALAAVGASIDVRVDPLSDLEE